MALVGRVNLIISQAELISQMGLFQRPAAYEELVKNEIVPVLLAVAEHIDGFNEPLPDDPEQVSVAEVLNEFQQQLTAFQQQNLKLMQENDEFKQEIKTLKGRMTKLQKSSTGAAA